MGKEYRIYSDYVKKHDLVGIIHCTLQENLEWYYRVEILVPPERLDFPIDLLGVNRDWGLESQPEIIRWLESRVVPRNRQFLNQMLEAVGLTEWDLDALLKLNKGRVTDDKFEVEIVYT